MNQFCAAFPNERLWRRPPLFSLLAIISLLFVGLSPVRADDPDGQYIQIFDLIQQADLLKKNGQVDPALAKYREAQTALAKFQHAYPERNAKVISYRTSYVSAQIAALAPQASSAPSTNEPSSTSKPAATGGGSTQVKLTDPGTEPRKVLRFHPKPGDKQSMLMTLKMGMEMKIGDAQGQPIKLPAMKLAVDFTVQDVATNGDVTYDVVMSDANTVEDPDVIPQVAEAMKAGVAAMKGLSGKGTISSRGINKVIEIKPPPGADPQVLQGVEQMKEMMSHVVVALPEEAVGSGAKWETKMQLKSQGMKINQTIIIQLASPEGEKCNVKTTVTQTASNQKIQNPMMPGTQVDLTRMTGTGTGEITFDLAQLLSQASTAEIHSETSMAVNAVGQKQTMAMKMDQSIQIESK